MTMGIVALASLAARIAAEPAANDDVYLETHQFGCKGGKAIKFSFRISRFNDNVFPLHIAKLAQPLAEGLVGVPG